MIKNEAENLHSLFIEIEKNIMDEKWDDAISIMETAQGEWEKYKEVWPTLIDHFEIDNVNTNMAKLKSYILNKDKIELLSNLAALKILIKHIPEKESFLIQNIL